MKLVNQDPFSNGTEHLRFEEMNCDKCIKSSHITADGLGYTKIRCAIQRDIITRMGCNEPIAQRTIDICRSGHCPFLRDTWPQRKRRPKHEHQETTLF